MSKGVTYICQKCSAHFLKAFGRCPHCGEWGTISEVMTAPTRENISQKSHDNLYPIPLSKVEGASSSRLKTGLEEFDRVLGGGAVLSSVVLLGGDPGVGKSTLLIQTAAAITGITLYVSGEENPPQIKARAERLSLDTGNIKILSTTSLDVILHALESEKPSLIIIDSIQTIFSSEAGEIPGTVNQLKFCAAALIDYTKVHNCVLIMVAHATKDGSIAGPNTLMHMVDTVLSFERNAAGIRFLYVKKNRFGSADNLGIFSMDSGGLKKVLNSESLFLGERGGKDAILTPGACVSCVVDCARAFLVEVEALTTESKSSISRVYSEKLSSDRVATIAAIIEARVGLRLSSFDIYVSSSGDTAGAKLSDRALDSALALAIYSARTGVVLPKDIIVIGELSLSGAIRVVSNIDLRIETARRLGFKKIYCASKNEKTIYTPSLGDLIKKVFSN